MSYGDCDYDYDDYYYFYDHDQEKDEFHRDVKEMKDKLSGKTDDEILQTALNCGKKLNDITSSFPAFDVAQKLNKNKWTPTPKQRRAIINITAFYLTQKEYGEV